YTLGRKLSDTMTGRRISWRVILKLDALYYSGVTAMVGFWLLAADVATPFSAWAAFASSYLAVVAVEPLFTYALVRLLKRHENTPLVNTCFAVKSLKLAD
ncbi:MAG: energy-coupling factor ABC transporter permease, partial [Betaproteobacteria bacterium]|nr:energy-coupling factor ABC transporter permease [Betaproteobacteria bacterium]